ncbi:diphosphate--fructose-6-phosphate 1-phosphotrans ferase [Desulfonema ishimotonii]|uniref:ATP-dependent 6-phosphofructokinase n=1 Tax=Desulfonema ishimotonii TaxID=45657 RepID=A0A401G4D6_9BACT|nr:ATP-dependent 6-phosphofructokinase [Desulfonema ishimotonii]GBC63995.1 diphosphate--fructose-6-phosphate 1-phosphotrans ferase [Desulfonema ishimotonii]
MDFDTIPTTIPMLGTPGIPTPIQQWQKDHQRHFVSDDDQVVIDVHEKALARIFQAGEMPSVFELAGPREQIYFDPSKLKCALVTCGGLCPGLNGIIRSVVLELFYGYGVRNIYGIRYGLQGFIPRYGHGVVELTPAAVGDIIRKGGSFLGSSRGPQDVGEIVDCLERMNIRALFMVGGDGTLMAATRIADTILERGLKISVVGIPKTIDNDIYMVSRSFGFDTAVDVATQSIRAAHNEAKGYPNGIGLIKLMGRYSGFIAATAALAQQDVNFVLIPEVDFDMDGPDGFMETLERRMADKGHAVIVVAEGAGQRFFRDAEKRRDASGNIRLNDIGLFLKEAIVNHFKARKTDISIKYIDPSYMIRSLPANSNDHVFCSFLGRSAVHAAMAGKTKLLIGHWNNHFVHVPMAASAGKRKQVSPDGRLWQSVLGSTGQGMLRNI